MNITAEEMNAGVMAPLNLPPVEPGDDFSEAACHALAVVIRKVVKLEQMAHEHSRYGT